MKFDKIYTEPSTTRLCNKLYGKRYLPNVFGKTILDELLVLALVQPHEDGVVPNIGTGLEVENHPCF